MKNIVADLREILHFETMSGTLVNDVLTLQQTNRRILNVFYFSNNFKSTNNLFPQTCVQLAANDRRARYVMAVPPWSHYCVFCTHAAHKME